MRLTCITLALISVALSATATNAIAARKTSLRESCAGGRVLNTTTVRTNGHDLKITTTSCSGFDGHAILPPAARAENVQKRQESICGGDCAISCDVPSGNAPFIDDCDQLTDALEGLFPQSLTAPAQTVTTFEVFTCGVAFLNLDSVDMNYCYIDLGFHLAIIASDCFPTFDGPNVSSDGFCIPPQTPGNEWGIEGYLV